MRPITENPESGEAPIVDAFTQQRIVKLRDEIATLQHDNEVYRSHRHHTKAEADTNQLRRFRLLAIREELRNMSASSKGN